MVRKPGPREEGQGKCPAPLTPVNSPTSRPHAAHRSPGSHWGSSLDGARPAAEWPQVPESLRRDRALRPQPGWMHGGGSGAGPGLGGPSEDSSQRCLGTYPLDTAGMGLPVLEFRLNAPILCGEEERAGRDQAPCPERPEHLASGLVETGFCPGSNIQAGPKGTGLLPKPCCKVLGNATSGVLKVGFQASSISTAWECARKADAQASHAGPPQSVFTKPSRGCQAPAPL